ncbi:hypothetical protein KGO95_03715 [Patescibacteria group bacterium]|nr:hypothetical protein [Patescibacteria group bacterium]
MDEFLDRLGKKLHPPNFLDRWWRRMRNHCEQCGAKLIQYENYHGKNFVCSGTAKHVRYAADINITAALIALIFVLAAVLFAQNCGLTSPPDRPHRNGQRELYMVPDPPR